MNTNMEIFKNEEFGSVRIVKDGDKYLFCGSDVAKALGYAIPTKAVNTHCKGVSKMEAPTKGGVQQLLFISEGDVYRLITHSKLPSVERFEKWVFDEVLPSIRKTGGYLAGQEQMSDMELVSQALIVVNKLLTEREHRVKELSGQVEELQPKADYYDDLVECNLLTNFRDASKEFGMSQKDFVQLLLDRKYIYRDARKRLRPYKGWVAKGMFQMKEFRTKSGFVNVHSLLTVKGRDIIRRDVKQIAATMNN